MKDRYDDIEIEIVGGNYRDEESECSSVAEPQPSVEPDDDYELDESEEPESQFDELDGAESDGSESGEEQEGAARKSRSLLTIFLGSYIVGPHTKKMMPYIVFVTVLAILYIVNGFAINAQHRKHSQLTEQVKELRSKSRAINAIKMQEMRRSSILKRCQERGIELEESVVPPKIVKK